MAPRHDRSPNRTGHTHNNSVGRRGANDDHRDSRDDRRRLERTDAFRPRSPPRDHYSRDDRRRDHDRRDDRYNGSRGNSRDLIDAYRPDSRGSRPPDLVRDRDRDRDQDRRNSRKPDLIRDRRRSRSPRRSHESRSKDYRPRSRDGRSREDHPRRRDNDDRHRPFRARNEGNDEEQAEKEKQAARRAKLEAWKEAQAKKKAEEDARNSSENILKSLDEKIASSDAAPIVEQKKAKKSATFKTLTGSVSADNTKPPAATGDEPNTAGKIGVFAFGGKPTAPVTAGITTTTITGTEKPAKTALGFGDDDDAIVPRSLGKLPTPELGDGDAALANDDMPPPSADPATDDSMDVDEPNPVPDGDTEMVSEANEEDVDPLEAFMSTLSKQPTSRQAKVAAKATLLEQDDGAAGGLDTLEEEEDFMAIAKKKVAAKDLKDVDHKKIVYPDFRKSFYVEPVETKGLDEDDVANLRFELDGIKIRGKNVPKPVLTWGQCGLLTPVLAVISRLGYAAPTPIQSQAIPAIMSGRDVIGVAKTGSGKTIAFLMPMFRHIKDQPPLKTMEGPIAIILAPTRELANQIFTETKPFVSALGLRSEVCYGQQSLKGNIDTIKKGVEIIVATPGRLVDLATVNKGQLLSFRRVTYFVMDEADRLWDMGFEPQVMKILNQVRPDRQCIMFSATFPKNMEVLARKVLHNPVEITIGGKSTVAPEITQVIEVRAQDTKFFRLLEILGENFDKGEDFRVLIFVERQETADALLGALLKKGYPCGSIHGGKDQVDRSQTIEDFKSGALAIMIATSVAARGLDVKQLKLVINYDTPSHLEDYVHRVGRTGRAGETGTAITFITPDQERYSVDLTKALKMSKQEVPEPLKNLADGFLEKVKEGKAKASSAGFGGKGLDKLDNARDDERGSQRKQFKIGDEPDDEEKSEKEKAKEKAIEDKIMAGTSSGAAVVKAASPEEPGSPVADGGLTYDTKIVVHKTEKPVAKVGGRGRGGVDPLAAVRAAAASINGRLSQPGSLRPGQPVDNRGPDAGAYHATLEINDFPQKARWAVTNRTNVAKILDQYGVSITTKGNYYDTAKGKVPGPTDLPKLYLLVEGETENEVYSAMKDLVRLLKDATIAAAETASRAPVSGRYNVI